MTENLAGRGEGLKERIAALHRDASIGEHVHETESLGMDYCRICWTRSGAKSKLLDLMPEILAALEAAAPPGTAPREPKNARELAEKLCDCADRTLNGHARELANELREEILEVCRDWTRAALATPSPQAPAEPTAEHNRLAASLCGCGTPYMSDCERCERIAAALAKVPRSGEQSSGLGRSKGEPFNLSPNAESAPSSVATQEQPAGSAQVVTDLQVALRIVGDWKEDSRGLVHVHKDAIRKAIVAALRSAGNCGSPRKVGEDGPVTRETLEHWLRVVKSTLDPDGWDCGAPELRRMREQLEFELSRSSSVPVGEQKQEEGV